MFTPASAIFAPAQPTRAPAEARRQAHSTRDADNIRTRRDVLRAPLDRNPLASLLVRRPAAAPTTPAPPSPPPHTRAPAPPADSSGSHCGNHTAGTASPAMSAAADASCTLLLPRPSTSGQHTPLAAPSPCPAPPPIAHVCGGAACRPRASPQPLPASFPPNAALLPPSAHLHSAGGSRRARSRAGCPHEPPSLAPPLALGNGRCCPCSDAVCPQQRA